MHFKNSTSLCKNYYSYFAGKPTQNLWLFKKFVIKIFRLRITLFPYRLIPIYKK